MIAAGEIKDAIGLLAEDLSDRPNDLGLHGRYHRLLAAHGDAALIESHADQYMTLLVKSQNWREAIELFEDTVARSPEWAMREVGNIVPLAQAALRSGNPKLAGRLVRAFDRKHPNHPDIPRAYLLGAQLMAEYGNKPEEAERILRYLVKRHAADPAAVEAQRYLDVMRRTAK
jgi:tetratricopeptide (TPR) repeat protein